VAPVALLAIAAVLIVCVLVSVVSPVATVSAEEEPLTVEVSEALLGLGADFTVGVEGKVSTSLAGASLVVYVRGPISTSEIGESHVTSGSTKSVTLDLNLTNSPGLTQGEVDVEVTVPGTLFTASGAYLVRAQVRSGSDLLANGATWMGMVASRPNPLDVAVVLPVRLGVHRDWEGVFFDQVLEEATLPVGSGANTLRGLAPAVDQLSGWRFTLAIEPILLTQLRDMADGYVSSDAEGNTTEVGDKDLAAQSAAATISDLVAIASRESVEIVASPYTGADLNLLAAQGWPDGLEAIQMGKQELQTTLGIESPLGGAYAADLNVTGGSLSYYAGASVEYVVVGSNVASSLAEVPAAGTVAVRAENGENDRATLIFASDAAGAAMRAPWDVNVFAAAFAADLASAPTDALVIAPKDLYGLIPTAYVQDLGSLLLSYDWIRTQTLGDLLGMYPPDSRPIVVENSPVPELGYIQSRLLDEVHAAHGPVTDLGSAADPSKIPVNHALRLLYVAESSWWTRTGVSPDEASMGLAYARQARMQAEGELDKVNFAGEASSLIGAGSSKAKISMENGAEYPIGAELRLAGEGLSFPDGDRIEIQLQPGRTDLEVQIVREEGAKEVRGQLVVGSTVVDEISRQVSSVGLWTILPWVLAVAALLAGVGIFLLVRRRRRTRSDAQAK